MSRSLGLRECGQAIWVDFLSRNFVLHGDLKALVDRDGISGVTSNPSIFEKAIGQGGEYDAAFLALLNERDRSPIELYEAVAIDDIRAAADVLRDVYDKSDGREGFVSLEVSPYLAHDTDLTIAEAERLWRAVDRDNLMIKVPGTSEGLPAIEELISKGINVNITLLFSRERYGEVLDAYLRGLERLAAAGGDISKVASVASFFISRIDTVVDQLIDDAVHQARENTQKSRWTNLKGKVAISNAKLAYRHYKAVCASPKWKGLSARGARVQRLLWASTGAKGKSYRDVMYVEELIGRDTVNTLPLATLDAFRDHGEARESLDSHLADAKSVLAQVAAAGISLDVVTDRLVDDGLQLFADSFDKLLAAVAKKRTDALGQKLNTQSLALAADVEPVLRSLCNDWRVKGTNRALWAGDAAVWTGRDEAKWLGWLQVEARERDQLPRYQALAAWTKAGRFRDAVVLGIGGSSLAAEAIAAAFESNPGFPKLRILDSTDPAQIRRLEGCLDLKATLFIVASKSGGTVEPNALMEYFVARATAALGENVGRHFVAVTDPGTSLERAAMRLGFAHVIFGAPSVGGRYSALSPFGLVPAAVMGLDLGKFIDAALLMVRACGPDVPPDENPGVQLGLALAAAYRTGRDKITITAAKPLSELGSWIEQLLAESTGKQGKALLPVREDGLGQVTSYGRDRLFIDLDLIGTVDESRDVTLAALAAAAHPVIHVGIADRYNLGQEFFRFEIATAVASAVLGVNPFDQPDVEAAKVKTRALISAFESSGTLPGELPTMAQGGIAVYADRKSTTGLYPAGANGDLCSWLRALFAQLTDSDYVALLAYIDRSTEHVAVLREMQVIIRDAKRVATCVEFGPRFLHSTGQAYKGGANTGVFLQITTDDEADVIIPGQRASFGVVKSAQAQGDFEELQNRGRRALRIHISNNLEHGLTTVASALRSAFA